MYICVYIRLQIFLHWCIYCFMWIRITVQCSFISALRSVFSIFFFVFFLFCNILISSSLLKDRFAGYRILGRPSFFQHFEYVITLLFGLHGLEVRMLLLMVPCTCKVTVLLCFQDYLSLSFDRLIMIYLFILLFLTLST